MPPQAKGLCLVQNPLELPQVIENRICLAKSAAVLFDILAAPRYRLETCIRLEPRFRRHFGLVKGRRVVRVAAKNLRDGFFPREAIEVIERLNAVALCGFLQIQSGFGERLPRALKLSPICSLALYDWINEYAHSTLPTPNESAHRWRPAAGSRIAGVRSRAAIRWSAGFALPTLLLKLANKLANINLVSKTTGNNRDPPLVILEPF